MAVPETAKPPQRRERWGRSWVDFEAWRSAARNANPPGGIGNSYVARIFSTTPSTRMTIFGRTYMPAHDVYATSVSYVELTLQLRPEAFVDLSRDPIFDLRVRRRGSDF